MSRPGTAQDLEVLQTSIAGLREQIAEPAPLPPKATDWFKQKTYEDPVDTLLLKYWALFDAVKAAGGAPRNACPENDEYAVFLKLVLRLAGESETASKVLCGRVLEADAAGRGRVPYAAFAARMQVVAALVYPDASLTSAARLEKLFAAVTEENPNPAPGEDAGLTFKSIADVEPAKTRGEHAAAYFSGKAWTELGWSKGSLLPMFQDLLNGTRPPKHFVVLGDPAAGKSALGRELSDRLNLLRLDAAALAEKELASGTGGPLAEAVQHALDNEAPLAMDTQADLVAKYMAHPAVPARGYVLDDFPLLPQNAAGDAYMERWVQRTGVAASGLQVVNIVCRDGLSPADEWTKRFRKAKAAYAAAEEAERKLRGQEDAEAAAEQAKAAARAAAAAAGGGDEDADAEPPADEDDEEAGEKKAAAEAAKAAAKARRLQFDIARSVYKGRMLWFNAALKDVKPDAEIKVDEDMLADYEGDTPYLPLVSHASLSDLVQGATARGSYDEVAHYETPARQADAILHAHGHLVPADMAVAHEVKAPEEGADLEAAEAEVLEGLRAPLCAVWGRQCPVTYKECGVAVAGLFTLPAVFQGRVYFFTSRARRAAFVDAPQVYLGERPRMGKLPVLLVGKQAGLMTELGTDAAALAEMSLKHLGYTNLTVDEYYQTWKAAKDDEASRVDDYNTRKALLEKQLGEQEVQLEKLLKKKKAKEDKEKKGKKKKAAEEEAPKEEAEADADAEPEEKKPLSLEELKDQEVAAAVARAANQMSIVVNALEVPSLDQLEYLYRLGLLPETVVAVESAPLPKDDDEEEAAPAEEEDDDDAAAKPKEPEPDPNDMTHPTIYAKKVSAFVDKLATPPEDGDGGGDDAGDGDGEAGGDAAKPAVAKVEYKVVPLNAFNHTAFEFIQSMQYQLDPHAPKAKETEPLEDGGDDGGEDGDEEGTANKAEKPDPRLTPGPCALAQYGATGKHCPVTLRDRQMLVVGEPETAVMYRGRRWVFRSTAEKEVFLQRPYAYCGEGGGVLARPPPPSLWVVGTANSHVDEFCRALHDDYGIAELDFADVPGMVPRITKNYPGCPHAAAAAALLSEAEAFDAKQKERQEEKEAYEKAKEDGEEVEDNPELDEWEPEDAEAREERVFKNRVAYAPSTLQLRVGPHADVQYRMSFSIVQQLVQTPLARERGFYWKGLPTTEERLDALRAAGISPEAVVHCNIDKDAYLRKALPHELEKRRQIFDEKTKAAKERAAVRAQKAQERELRRWRRRNIGADDEDEEEEDGDDEEIAPVDADEVSGELSGVFDEEVAGKEVILAKVAEMRVPVVTVDAAATVTVLLATGMLHLNRNLAHRPSFFSAAYLTTHEHAATALRHGDLHLSKFGTADPVAQHRLLAGAHCPLVLKGEKKKRASDDADDAPPPAEPAPKGEGDDEDEEDAPPPEEEDEPEVELEGEELEELQKKVAAQDRARQVAKLPRPVVHGEELYWLESDAHVLQFLDHPERFTRQRPLLGFGHTADPHQALQAEKAVPAHGLPHLVLFVGDPPAEKRSIGAHIAANLDAVHITTPKLLESVIHSGTVLAEAVQARVAEGRNIDNALLAKCVVQRLGMADVYMRGCVLDDVVSVDYGLVEALDAALEGIHSVHNVIFAPEAVTDCSRTLYHYQTHYANVTELDDTMSHMRQLRTALRAIRESQYKRLTLTQMRLCGRPAEIAATSQPDASIRERASKFGTYCVWHWVNQKVLVDCAGTRGGLFEAHAAEYGGKVYFFSTLDGVRAFLKDPVKYEDLENMYPLPLQLPMRLDIRTAEQVLHTTTTDWARPQPTHWQFHGFCPVTLYKTRDHIGLKGEPNPTCLFGVNNCAVLYLEKNYRMRDAECLQAFMQQPWVFIDGAKLPKRLPIPKSVLPQLDTVSMENFLREALYEGVVRAMLDVGELRPGFPGTSVQASAIRYVAAHLRANNPYNTPLKSQVYKKNLEEYVEACTLSQFFSSKDKQRAPEETMERKARLWSDIKHKRLDPTQFDKFNLDADDEGEGEGGADNAA